MAPGADVVLAWLVKRLFGDACGFWTIWDTTVPRFYGSMEAVKIRLGGMSGAKALGEGAVS
jgi:hypothetical protein